MGFLRKSTPASVSSPWGDPAAGMKSRLWGLFFYMVVLALMGSLLVLAVHYQPLSTANFASSGPATSTGGNMIRVTYASGGTFSFGFLLENGGPVPVKIDKVQVTGKDELLVPVRIQTAEKRFAGSVGVGDPDLKKFLPFSLGAGERRWIIFRTRFANCRRFPPNSFETYTQFLVTYHVLGFTKHSWVPLPKNVRVDSPPASGCPARAG